jgi:hypothetical protein
MREELRKAAGTRPQTLQHNLLRTRTCSRTHVVDNRSDVDVSPEYDTFAELVASGGEVRPFIDALYAQERSTPPEDARCSEVLIQVT